MNFRIETLRCTLQYSCTNCKIYLQTEKYTYKRKIKDYRCYTTEAATTCRGRERAAALQHWKKKRKKIELKKKPDLIKI